VAVAALAPATSDVVHSKADAMLRIARFIFPPQKMVMSLRSISQTNEAPHKPVRPVYYDASQRGVLMIRRLFLSHPQQAGESYFQHQCTALSFALPLLGAGLAATMHAIVPGIFERTAGDIIRQLHARLEKR
jgi:hypothetical protein